MNLPAETAQKMQKRHSGTSIFGQKSVRVKHRNNFFSDFKVRVIHECALYTAKYGTLI